MQIELRELSSTDAERIAGGLENFSTSVRPPCSMSLCIEIGEVGRAEQDIFYSFLIYEFDEYNCDGNIIKAEDGGIHYTGIYNYSELEEYIRQEISKIQVQTWPEVGKALAHIGRWEFLNNPPPDFIRPWE